MFEDTSSILFSIVVYFLRNLYFLYFRFVWFPLLGIFDIKFNTCRSGISKRSSGSN